MMCLQSAVIKIAGDSVQHHDVRTIVSLCIDGVIIEITMFALQSTCTRGPREFGTQKLPNQTKSIDAIRTKTDTKCDQCLELFRLAALLQETIPHLKQIRLLLNDSSAKVTHRKKAATDMNKFDIPLIEKAIDIINSVAAVTCPLAGMKEHFRKKHNDEKDTVLNTRLSRDITPSQYMISLFLSEETTESPRKALPRVVVKVITPSASKSLTDLGYDPDDEYSDIHLPLPKNETLSVYTKPEAAEILSKTETRSSWI